jgi:predicted transposase/invertase (TIGR01784 family)
MLDKPQDRQKYEDSLKYYRDMENSLEVQYKAGAKDTKKEIALNMIKLGLSDIVISQATGLDIEQIEQLRNRDKHIK